MPVPFRVGDETLFLSDETPWLHDLGSGFHGKKFLGKGSSGVVWLWEYKSFAGEPGPPISQVVVKMSQVATNEKDRDFLSEGAMGKVIARFKAPHLVKQYGGNRLGDEFYEFGDVVKILLEYCPGGDLQQFMPSEKDQVGTRLDEVDLWQIFKCLAMGVYALERRTERATLKATIGDKAEILHHDLKLDNVFFGHRDLPDHARLPIAKIGDFGEAELVKSFSLQTDAYGSTYDNKGAPFFRTPEAQYKAPGRVWLQSGFPLTQPRKGTCSNIWQVGAIMNTIIRLELLNFNPAPLAKDILPKQSTLKISSTPRTTLLASELNHSQGLEDPKITKLYSNEFLALVQECLFRTAGLRPKAPELVERTKTGLQYAMKCINDPAITNPFNRPLILDGFKNMLLKTGGDKYPPEPPVVWGIDYERSEDGTYRLASTTKPSLKVVKNTAMSQLNSFNEWARTKSPVLRNFSVSAASMVNLDAAYSTVTGIGDGGGDGEAVLEGDRRGNVMFPLVGGRKGVFFADRGY